MRSFLDNSGNDLNNSGSPEAELLTSLLRKLPDNIENKFGNILCNSSIKFTNHLEAKSKYNKAWIKGITIYFWRVELFYCEIGTVHASQKYNLWVFRLFWINFLLFHNFICSEFCKENQIWKNSRWVFYFKKTPNPIRDDEASCPN